MLLLWLTLHYAFLYYLFDNRVICLFYTIVSESVCRRSQFIWNMMWANIQTYKTHISNKNIFIFFRRFVFSRNTWTESDSFFFSLHFFSLKNQQINKKIWCFWSISSLTDAFSIYYLVIAAHSFWLSRARAFNRKVCQQSKKKKKRKKNNKILNVNKINAWFFSFNFKEP